MLTLFRAALPFPGFQKELQSPRPPSGNRPNHRSFGNLRLQQLQGQRVLYHSLNGPLQGPGSIGRIVALPGNEVLRLRCD